MPSLERVAEGNEEVRMQNAEVGEKPGSGGGSIFQTFKITQSTFIVDNSFTLSHGGSAFAKATARRVRLRTSYGATRRFSEFGGGQIRMTNDEIRMMGANCGLFFDIAGESRCKS